MPFFDLTVLTRSVGGFAVLGAAASLPAAPPDTGPAPAYAEPDVSKWLFDRSQMHLGADARARAATVLADYVSTELASSDAKDYQLAARALGVALRLDPQSRAAVVANGLLYRGRRPVRTTTGSWSRAAALKELVEAAAACRAAGGAADRAAAGYLLAIVLELDPGNVPAAAEAAAVARGGLVLDWSWAPGGPPVGAGAVLAAKAFVITEAPYEVFRYQAAKAARAAVFSADGRRVISAGADGVVRSWDALTGAEVRRYEGDAAGANALCLTNDGRTLVAGGNDGRVRTWDVETGRILGTVPAPAGGAGAGVPDGIGGLSVGPDARIAAAAHTVGGAAVWDLRRGTPLLRVAERTLQGMPGAGVSPDGRLVAIARGSDVQIYAFDGTFIRDRRKLVSDFYPITSCRFLPDSRRLMTCSGHTLRVWDTTTGEELNAIKVGSDTTELGATALSADGRYVAVAGTTRPSSEEHAVTVLEVEMGKKVAEVRRAQFVAGALAFSPDGRMLVTCNGAGVTVWSFAPVPGSPPAVAAGTSPAGTGGEPPPPAAPPADPASLPIASAEYRDRVKGVVRERARVRALSLVSPPWGPKALVVPLELAVTPGDTPKGANGATLDPDPKSPGPILSGATEGWTAVGRRYHRWAGQKFAVSSPLPRSDRDGPDWHDQATAAYALLLLNALEGVDLDDDCAVAGGLDENWKMTGVRGVGLKLKAAAAEKVKRVVIPVADADRVADLLVVEGDAVLWQTQIFAAPTLQKAQAVARKDRDAKWTEAISLFEGLQKEHTASSVAFRSPAGIGTLKKIAALAPEHLSARYLLLAAEGKAPRTLSREGTLNRIYQVAPNLWLAARNSTTFGTRAAVQAERDKLIVLRRKAHPDTSHLFDAFAQLAAAVQPIWSVSDLANTPPAVTKAIETKAASCRAALQALTPDPERIREFGS